MAAAPLLPGCSSGDQAGAAESLSGRLRADAVTARTSGDWDDIDAAVGVGVGRTEVAIVARYEPSEFERVYELKTLSGAPGLLTVSRDPSAAAGPTVPVRLTLRASVGRFGNPELEHALLANVQRRLKQLEGVEFAPVK